MPGARRYSMAKDEHEMYTESRKWQFIPPICFLSRKEINLP